MIDNNSILLTIDVEDWFQVENFKPWIHFSSWSSCELRVEKNTHRLLDLFDTFVSTRNPKPGTRNPISATFFILGWIAERLPNLAREIHKRGHEVASHGYYHNLCSECSSDDLKTDLINSKTLLEDIIGDRVYGYRAPSFAINKDILKTIQDCGYLYDSSYNSFSLHGRYGHVDLFERPTNGFAVKLSEKFYELPISNLKLSSREIFTSLNSRTVQLGHDSDSETHFTGAKIHNLVLPWGGGAYFRLIPFLIFKLGVQTILKKDKAYLFYMHPWEIDTEQPKVKKASFQYKFRHYLNLNKTASRLSKLVDTFHQSRFITCRQYLEEILNSA